MRHPAAAAVGLVVWLVLCTFSGTSSGASSDIGPAVAQVAAPESGVESPSESGPGSALPAPAAPAAESGTGSNRDRDAGADSVPPPAPTPGSEMRSEMAERTRQLDAIEARLGGLRQQLLDREQHRDALYRELEQNERDIAALASAGRQLTLMVGEQQQTVADLGVRLEQTRQDLETAQRDLAELLRSAYAMGRGDRLRMLLNRDDPARSERVFGYYHCIGRVRAARVDAVRHLAAELATLRAEAEEEAQRLERLAQRQSQTRLRLETAQTERGAIIADLDANIAEGRGEVATLNANAQSLRTLIERLRDSLQIAAEIDLSQEDFVSRKGRLSWPIDDAHLIQRFKQVAADGGDDLHADGVLIAAEEGSEVHAVHHGRVIYGDWLRGFGMVIVIDHGDGYMTLYGHNQTLLKEVGEWIGTGEVIALTGSSGGGGTGLYFALRYLGEPMDPELWCGRG